MKIVHLIDYFQPKVGYQEYFLAREHQKMGHQVVVITSDRYFPFPNYEQTYTKLMGPRITEIGDSTEEGVVVKRLSCREIVPGSLVILSNLYNVLESLKPDVVFCHNMYSPTSYRAALYRGSLGYKLIYDTHASAFNSNLTNTFAKKIYHSLYHMVAVRKIKQEAHAIFAIGDDEKEFICSHFGLLVNSVPVVRLGVDVERFAYNESARKKTRAFLKFTERDIVLVYAGKVTSNKDVHILFEAIKKLDYDRLKLLVIGGGDIGYKNMLKSILPAERVRWMDFVENKHLPSLYCAADIGVWPGDPSAAMLEAMACRLPLILAHWSETQYLDASKAVLRFTRSNIKELTGVLDYLVKESTLRKKMANHAATYAHKELSWQRIAAQTLALLNHSYRYN